MIYNQNNSCFYDSDCLYTDQKCCSNGICRDLIYQCTDSQDNEGNNIKWYYIILIGFIALLIIICCFCIQIMIKRFRYRRSTANSQEAQRSNLLIENMNNGSLNEDI